jgi:hypothetical protein
MNKENQLPHWRALRRKRPVEVTREPDETTQRYNAKVQELLNQVQYILNRDCKTYADLARDIGRSYHQTYAWMKVRRFNPGGTGVMLLQEWRDKHATINLRA